MPYTLTVWGLWMIGAAVIGLVIGWLLGRRSDLPVDDAPRPWRGKREVARLRAKPLRHVRRDIQVAQGIRGRRHAERCLCRDNQDSRK